MHGTHEEFLIACLPRDVSAGESHSDQSRIRSARIPARKSSEELNFDHARGLKREPPATSAQVCTITHAKSCRRTNVLA